MIERGAISRRQFLATTVAAALAACSNEEDASGPTPTATAPPTTPGPTPTPDPTPLPTATPEPVTVDLATDPFTLGVASGDPTPTSAILWTRLAPEPLTGGGMPTEVFTVEWEVATDPGFDTIVASGTQLAVPTLAHSLHVDATGLEPDSWYTYRFRLGQYTSPIGRTRTLPPNDSSPTQLRVGFSSCQDWEAGFYAAHRHLADEDLDLFLWLGDYIYENGPTADPLRGADGAPRVHTGPEVIDLAGYRDRYALYRSDADLQRHHAARPWWITWDDHEVSNDYAGPTSEDDDPVDAFLDRRAAAYQAWYEHMPVRLDAPDGPDYRIYRDFVWGDLARVFLLDGRQYRDDQPTDGEFIPIPGFDETLPVRTVGPTALDPEHRFLGADQERWLRNGVLDTDAIWKVLAQQVVMHGLDVLPAADAPLTVTDTWDGYFANRQQLLQSFLDQGIENLVVLTGDFHAASVGELRADPFDLDAPVVGTEFMATSISSAFPEAGLRAAPLILAFNPQVKFFDARKGYSLCELTRSSFTAVYKALDDVRDPTTAISTIATFVVDAGVAGAREI